MTNWMRMITRQSARLLGTLVSVWSALALHAADIDVETAAEILGRRDDRSEGILARALAQSQADRDFRDALVRLLSGRLKAYREDWQGNRDIRALRVLGATEALPVLLRRWSTTEKRTWKLEVGDPRIELLRTIAGWLPAEEAIDFLIQTETDETEAPTVRFRALIMLCATAHERARQHVLSDFDQARERFANVIVPQALWPTATAWDSDADLLNDYFEPGLLLDPSKPDTDGDGIADGSDRNPLTVEHAPRTADQQCAQFLFYVYTKYLSSYAMERPKHPTYHPRYSWNGPFSFSLWVVSTVDDHDGTPSLFQNLELIGIDGVVLAVDREQTERLEQIHGDWRPPQLYIHRGKTEEDGSVEFSLCLARSSDGLIWKVRMRRFGDAWLPVMWTLDSIGGG